MVWLCTDHQKHDGITVLSDEVADLNAVSHDPGIDMNSAFQDFTSNANERRKEVDASKPVTERTGLSSFVDAIIIIILFVEVISLNLHQNVKWNSLLAVSNVENY